MSKTLSSTANIRRDPEMAVSAVAELHNRLTRLKASLDSKSCGAGSLFEGPVVNLLPPYQMSSIQIIYLRYTYYSALLDVHTTLTYPWSQGVFDLGRHPAIRTQVDQSSQVLAEACRAALLTTRYVNILSSTPLM